ncbi:MAG: hypothetical protein JNK48_26865 [Bryobacterales bacterium]|nr:hypothetical protein [Bryobacterales bacterium]
MATKNYTTYNVDASVGKHGVNQSVDVMLVQYMLSRIGKSQGLPLQPPKTPIVPDGRPGPTLEEWILWFQKAVRQTGNQVVVDGRIDPIPGDPYSSAHTMMHLNVTFRRRFRKEHDSLESDPMAPEPIRAKFRADESF